MIVVVVIEIVVVISAVVFIGFGAKFIVHALYAGAAHAIYSAAHALFEVSRITEVRRFAFAPFAVTVTPLFGLRRFQISLVPLQTFGAHVVHFAAERIRFALQTDNGQSAGVIVASRALRRRMARARQRGDRPRDIAHRRCPMVTLEFSSSLVSRDDGKIVTVVFDGEPVPSALAVLICSEETARVLAKNLRSALRPRTT